MKKPTDKEVIEFMCKKMMEHMTEKEDDESEMKKIKPKVKKK